MIGSLLAHYHVLEEIGRGGMGVVYKARDTKLDRIVAIKCLPARVAKDTRTMERFIQEAKAASSLDDVNICTVFDIGEASDGQLFIVMAYYDGSTLAEIVEKGPLDIERAAEIARQMAKGLSAAHEAGIVHRDVKPGNVMVTKRGVVKLLDFGVAKLGESSDLTREGSTVGTASYMSPEQARGEAVDARSDLWSVGAVLYEMLAGKRAFGGGYEAAVAYSIINEDPPPVAAARPEIPDGLAAIVTRALAKSAQDRFESAAALAHDLARYAGESAVETTSQAPVTSHAPTPPGPAETFSFRRITVVFAVVGALVTALVYGAMIALGLPDWVLPVAIVLLLAGFPITVYSASVEKRRAQMGSGEIRKLSGLQARLSTRLALLGGVVAGTLLVVSIGAYAGLRAAGIGPFASLISSGLMDEKGTIIVAQFENRTEVPDLGATITEALRIDLSQSTAVQVMDRATMKAALLRMQMSPDTALSAGISLQIAQREGVKAIVEGEVTSVGEAIQIVVRVLDAQDGIQVAAFRDSAPSAADALVAIDRLSAQLREEIGESLVSIRNSPALESVTTGSIDALRHYTRAVQASNENRIDDSMRELESAIKADSGFGMAYRKLFVLYLNAGIRWAKQDSLLNRAFALRDRMTDRERLITEGTFYAYSRDPATRDDEASVRAYEEVLQRWPDDLAALNNLAGRYSAAGRREEAEPLFRRALQLQEGFVFRQNYARTLLNLGRLDELRNSLAEMDEFYPGNVLVPEFLAALAFSLDSLDAAVDLLARSDERARNDESAATTPDPTDRAMILLAQGRFDEARRLGTGFVDSKEFLDLMKLEGNTMRPDSAAETARLDMEIDVAAAILLSTGDTVPFDRAIAAADAYHSDRDPDSELVDDDGRIEWDLIVEAEDEILLGKLEAADRLLERVDSLRSAGRPFLNDDQESEYTLRRAYLNGRLGLDPAVAARDFEAAIQPDDIRYRRDWLGELRELAGDPDGAIAAYTQFVSAPAVSPYSADRGRVAPIQFRLAEMLEERGDLDGAITWYSKMAERWKNADAVLQPRVEEARRRIEQLMKRKAEEG